MQLEANILSLENCNTLTMDSQDFEITEEQHQRQLLVATTREHLLANDIEEQLGALATIQEYELDELLVEVITLLQNNNETLRKKITDFLIDIHSSALVTHMQEALKRSYADQTLALIISICWMSPLDFSPIISVLLPFIVHSDLQVVIETITSLEIAFEHASRKQLEAALKQLKELHKTEKRSEIRPLLAETISTCSNILQQVINAERNGKITPAQTHHHHDGCHCDNEHASPPPTSYKLQ